jgi:hypothetical protein
MVLHPAGRGGKTGAAVYTSVAVEFAHAPREYWQMLRMLCLVAWLFLASAFAARAQAWGPQGHRTVGAIADRLLNAGARAQVAQLLSDDRDKFGNSSGRSSLEAVADWADEIYGTPAAHAAWHYDDMPVCGSQPLAHFCPGGECNSEALKRLIALLADRRSSAPARNEALKWVVHLVGDLHQPLHAADNHDRGGNGVQVALLGVRTRGRESLHRAWDNDLVRLALHTRNRQQTPPDIDALTLESQQLVRDAGQGTPDTWTIESNNLARNVAYRYPGFACDAAPGGIVVLGPEYQQTAEDVIHERLLLAGARLAAVLNGILGSAH